ncbi:MAG: amidase family protein, partial [bacterium]|nr:amidase family protein [bacterium]
MRELVEHTPTVGRRGFLQALGGLGIGTAAFHRALALQAEQGRVSAAMIAEAEWIAGIELDEEQREQVADAVDGILRSGERLREIPVDADTVPALTFRPDFFYEQAEAKRQGQVSAQVPAQVQVSWSVEGSLAAVRPRSVTSETDMAFASIQQQASWLATGQVSSRQLTELYLKRLKKYDPLLKCVVTLLEELALEQADASDERRGKGISLGVFDGIPWVAKDL